MNLTREELRSLVLEELGEMEEMDEGFLSRMKAAWSGGKERGKAWGRNIGKIGTGGTLEDPRKAMAAGSTGSRFEGAAAKFEKMGKDFYKDLQKMEVGIDNPEIAREVQKLKASLKGVVTRIKNLSTKIQGMQTAEAPDPNQPAP